MSKQNRDKNFSDRLKKFLKGDKKTIKNEWELTLSDDDKEALGPNSEIETRIKSIKNLQEALANRKMNEVEMRKLWMQVRDLAQMDKLQEHRHLVLKLLSTISSTTDNLGLTRTYFFNHIQDVYLSEDVNALFDFLCIITNEGRTVKEIELDIGPFLSLWLPILLKKLPTALSAITYTTNIFKFNAAFITDEDKHTLVSTLLLYVIMTKEEMDAFLYFLDSLIAYCYIPDGLLVMYVASLARNISVPYLVEPTWKVIRNLCTSLGNSAVFAICEAIETAKDFHIVRGAIYFLSNALWTSNRVPSLTLNPMAVLSTLQTASENSHPLVIYETAITIHKLVSNKSSDLHLVSWKIVLEILSRLFFYTANYENKEQGQMIFNVLHSTLDTIQEQIDSPLMWRICPDYFYLVNCYSEQRKVSSVLKLIEYKFKVIHPNEENWTSHLNVLLQKYLKEDPRHQIRLYVLEELTKFFKKFRYPFGEAMCNRVLLLQLDELENDPDMTVRKAGITLLVKVILKLNIPALEKLIFVIEKAVFSVYSHNEQNKQFKAAEVEDIAEGISGLIKIFKRKMWTLPSAYPIQAYQILVAFLEMHYRKPHFLAAVPSIRTEIFKMIFEMRANSSYQLGLPNCPEAIYPYTAENAPPYLQKYSQYIVVDHKFGLRPTAGFSPWKKFSIGSPENLNPSVRKDPPPQSSVKPERISESFSELKLDEDLISGEEECQSNAKINKDLELPAADGTPNLQAGGDVSSAEEEADEIQDEPKKEIFIDGICLEPSTEITHLSLTNAARLVILALKEERDWPLLKLMLDKIPEVLQNKALILSKDGATSIDFLADNLYLLVTDQSLSTSQFSNLPQGFKRTNFNSCIYPVIANLAAYHQDLDMLHKKKVIQCLQSGMQSNASALCIRALTLCALEMRKAMSKMVSNVMFSLSKMSATESNAQPCLEFLSTLLHLPRVYSDFLPDQYRTVFAIVIPYTSGKFNQYIVALAYHVIGMWFLKSRLSYRWKFVNYISKNLYKVIENDEAHISKTSSYNEQNTQISEESIQYQKDMREACLDFMSRNCYETISPNSRRKSILDFLLNPGLVQRWLLGTRIITITTSGCTQRPGSNGLCEKCIEFCTASNEKKAEEPTNQDDLSTKRGRHRSEFHRQVPNEAKYEPQSKDDLHMNTASIQDGSFSYLIDKEASSFPLRKDRPSLSQESCSPSVSKDGKEPHLCACWCKAWAEVHIRQPTGDVSYMVRLQNYRSASDEYEDPSLDILCSLYSPSSNYEHLNLNPDEYSDFRPARPQSGDSDQTLASETEGALGGIGGWSYSGSGPNSGAASLASSELRLHHLPDCEANEKEQSSQHRPICHCYSNPETNLKGAALPTSDSSHLTLSSTSDAHSDHLFATRIKTRTASGTVRRSNSIVGSSSPPPSSVQSSRSGHLSALQPRTCSTSAVTPEDDSSIDPNLQPMKRGRGHTISDMTPATRKSNLKLFSRRPTLGHTGGLSNPEPENANVGGGITNVTNSNISLHSDVSTNTQHTSAPYPPTTSSSSSSIGSLDGKHNQKDTMAGVSPSSFFLQLFYHGAIGGGYMRPIPLPNTPEIKRSLSLLDLMKPQVNHKIGVLYVGPYQMAEADILRNTSGSMRYLDFLEGLGTVYNFSDLPKDTFLGGLDSRGVDGDYVYLWEDDIMQIVFHVASAMPNKENDPNCNNKKRHIGNNYVTIVYNDRDCSYSIDTIKSQFNHAVVEIVPGDHNTNLVRLLCQPDLGIYIKWKQNEHPRLVSDNNLPVLVRQIALHVNLASMIWDAQKRSSDAYFSYWIQRLRKIRNIRDKVLGVSLATEQFNEHQKQVFPDPESASDSPYLDFIDLVNFNGSKSNQKTTDALFRR